MTVHTTNYYDTFIEVAEDTKATCGTRPPTRAKKTVAQTQYELLMANPYRFTSDEILFQVFVDRNNVTKAEHQQAKEHFFSKGQACLRTSPLAKTYGFGIHFDNNGKIAIYGIDTPEYGKFLSDPKVKKLKAMRSKR